MIFVNPFVGFGKRGSLIAASIEPRIAGFFDGDGDYLQVASNSVFGFGTGDFTIEYWWYPTRNTINETMIDTRPSDSSTPLVLGKSSSGEVRCYDGTTVRTGGSMSLNEWNHIAWSRSGTSNKIFLNGGLVIEFTNGFDADASRGLTIGSNVLTSAENCQGYVDDLRITKGVARYTADFIPPKNISLSGDTYAANVSLLLTMDGDDESTNFVDSSNNSLSVTAYGNARLIADTNPRISTGYFDGNGDWLTTPNTSLFDFSNSATDFTIEGWIYNTGPNVYRGIIGARQNAVGHGWCLYVHQSSNTLYMGSTIVGQGYVDRQLNTTTIPANTWTHFALVKDSSGYTGYTNGVSGSLIALNGGLDYQSGQPLIIGALGSQGEFPFLGYIDDIRITNGVARYTTNFTPPQNLTSSGDPYIANVSLLLNMSGTNASSNFIDSSNNVLPITASGDSKIIKPLPRPYFSPSNSEIAAIKTSLEAYYPLNSNLNDSSGNGHNATAVSGEFVYGSSYGKVNGGLATNLTGTNYATISNPITIGSAWSIQAWLNPYSGDPYSPGRPSGGNTQWICAQITGSDIFVLVNDPFANKIYIYANGNYVFNGGYQPTEGSWNHIVVTYNNGNFKYYQGGFLRGQATVSPIGSWSIDRLFNNASGSNNQYYGYIDELAIWTRELSSTEITKLYNYNFGVSMI